VTVEVRELTSPLPGRARVGLISDTHLPESRPELWPQAYRALEGCDAIIHAGDIHEVRFLDRLSDLAPTFAVRGNGEEGSGGRPVQPEDPRLRDAWMISIAGALIGAVHDAPVPEYPPDYLLAPELERVFGRRDLDVLVHGHTHVESVAVVESILCVNPGSPTYPHNLTTQLGTLGELTIDDGMVQATIWQLTDDGIHPFAWPAGRAPAEPVRALISSGPGLDRELRHVTDRDPDQ